MDRTELNADPVGCVLVAGSGGFIGRRLVALLRQRKAEVRAIGRLDCDLRRPGDVRDLLAIHHPRVIVNLARPTQATDRSGHDEHLEIARNLVAAARAAGVRRLIHLGSATEFGQAESPADDDTPLRPTTSFGRAKANASSLVLAAHGDGIRTTVLRPFSVYGSGDRPGHLIPAAIDAAFSGRALQLASGVKRDWVFVEDVASACALALDGRADGVAVNLASGVAVPNEQVVELVGGLAGQRIEIDPVALPPRPWDANIAGSTERARQLLGWTAGTGLRDGIRMTLAAGRTVVRHSGMAAAG